MEALIFGSSSMGSKLNDLDAPIANFTQSTGGLFFRNNNDLDLGFREVGMVPEVTYQLAIEPAGDGKYHHLRVKVRGGNHEFVQARPGYFAPGNQTAQASSLQQELDKVMAASDSVSEVPATVSANQAPLPNGSQALWVVVHLDVGRLKFDSHSGRHSQELLFVCALLDDQGQIVTGKESRMNLTLKDASFARLSKSGITAKNFLQAQPGRYRLREVVQEGLQGKLFASTTPIEIH
jgi:hypothetical protein